jgi:hypothetical protein
LAGIGLFGKNWSPNECLTFFRKFAKVIFPRKRSGYSICALVRRIFTYYVEDGKYDTSVLESALQEAIGWEPLFGPATRVSGMKFAVTTTTISDATLCLISNYNGEDEKSIDLSK